MPPKGEDLRRYVRWSAVLDALERDVDRAEKELDTAGGAGAVAEDGGLRVEGSLLETLPSADDLGPLPDGLTARARELAQRQTDAMGRGEDRLSALRRQLRAGEELRAGSESDPVYLDTTG